MNSVTDHTPAKTPFDTYLTEIDDTELLTPQRERELAALVAEGDVQARDEMVRANLRLVVNIARQYRNKGLPMEDLIAEGNLGLLRAVEGYDTAFGTRFSTYATLWVRQSIRRALCTSGRVVRLPNYAAALAIKWRQTAAVLQADWGRAPTDDEVAAELGLSRGKRRAVAKALRAQSVAQESEEAVGWSADEITARDSAPGEWLAASEETAVALETLGQLDGRASEVLRMRFGLAEEEPKTLREIGDRLGLTRERVRQIERDALAELRAALDASVAG